MRKALIVIDVQESFRQRENWAATSTPDIVAKTNTIVDAARRAGDLIIWVLHAEPGSGDEFDPANGFVRLMDGLSARPDEPTVVKTSHNAFTTTNLGQILTTESIHHLIVSGIQTEQCCETTTRVASDLGFAVTFVTEATSTTPIPHRDARPATLAEVLADPRTLSTAAIIERTEYALAGRFADIATVDEVVADAAARTR